MMLEIVPYTKKMEDLMCLQCDKVFTKKRDLSRHSLIHSGIKNFKCLECGKQFTQKGHLTQHLLVHSGVKSFQCMECGKLFSKKDNLTRHALTHAAEKRNLKCRDCNKEFLSEAGFKKHMKTHSEVDRFECLTCGKHFSQRSVYVKHTLIHSGIKNFKCTECGKHFTQKSHLSQHLLIHSGIKKFRCDECGKHFNQRSHLTQHLMIHAGLKRFQCSFCGKHFISKGDLDRHQLIHYDEKQFKCDICGKEFKTKDYVKRHMVTHRGVREHECSVCGKVFVHQSSLIKHSKTHKDGGGKVSKSTSDPGPASWPSGSTVSTPDMNSTSTDMPNWLTGATHLINIKDNGGPSLGIATWLYWVAARMAQVNNCAVSDKHIPTSTDRSDHPSEMSAEESNDGSGSAEEAGNGEFRLSNSMADRTRKRFSTIDTGIKTHDSMESRSDEDSADAVAVDETSVENEPPPSSMEDRDRKEAYNGTLSSEPSDTTDHSSGSKLDIATCLSLAARMHQMRSSDDSTMSVPPWLYLVAARKTHMINNDDISVETPHLLSKACPKSHIVMDTPDDSSTVVSPWLCWASTRIAHLNTSDRPADEDESMATTSSKHDESDDKPDTPDHDREGSAMANQVDDDSVMADQNSDSTVQPW